MSGPGLLDNCGIFVGHGFKPLGCLESCRLTGSSACGVRPCMDQNPQAEACATKIRSESTPEMGRAAGGGFRPLVGHGQTQERCCGAEAIGTRICLRNRSNSRRAAQRIPRCRLRQSSASSAVGRGLYAPSPKRFGASATGSPQPLRTASTTRPFCLQAPPAQMGQGLHSHRYSRTVAPSGGVGALPQPNLIS